VWVALLAATVASFGLGDGGDAHGRDIAGVAVVAIACFKVRLVGRHFMELDGAPRALRLAFDAYLAVLLTTLVVLGLAV
jgi:hypothetical protein